jgi:fucokinase
MSASRSPWDYLIVTASNALQAQAYESQLQARRELGLLPRVRESIVVPDLEGKRIGSGGSTLWCLVEILQRERARRGIGLTGGRGAIEQALSHLRILIVHAGGDSRRLPAYGPCGKIFVPLPGAPESALPPTLFDRLVPAFLALPEGIPGRGQVVVASGDALVRFDASTVEFTQPGLIALGCYATPEEASRHGVFCIGEDGTGSLYLQKPSIETQRAAGALDECGRAPLDIGVMQMDAAAAAALLSTFGLEPAGEGGLDFAPQARRRILGHGVDLYREICCALGCAATLEQYNSSARASGSTWPAELLAQLLPALRAIPFHVQLVPECRFLHFGSTRQLIESGLALAAEDRSLPPTSTLLMVNSTVGGQGRIAGTHSWMEGCHVTSLLELSGQNVITGVDVESPLTLPPEACLEVLPGRSRGGEDVCFVRCYGVRDTFKHSLLEDGQFCGRPLLSWLAAAGIPPDEVWPGVERPAECSLWNARVFPAVREVSGFRYWLWMYAPKSASVAELRAFRSADRYSAAEIALLTDQAAFHRRRAESWRSQPRHAARMDPGGRFRPAAVALEPADLA